MAEVEKDLVFGEYSKQQWKNVALAAKPDLTDEEYDEMWNGFMKLNKQIPIATNN